MHEPGKEAMWAALQQRLNKYQQRSHTLLKKGTFNTALSSSPLGSHLPHAAATSEGASDPAVIWPTNPGGVTFMDELLVTYPTLMSSAGDPTSSSHATIELLSAVPSVPASTAAAPSSHWKRISCAGDCSDNTGAGASAGSVCSRDSSSVSQSSQKSVRRVSSSLGHRILRPQSSSPIPVGSGSVTLGVEQLGSGDFVVDITPPTKVTQELNWSLDPDAGYVLEASTSGSIHAMPVDLAAAAADLTRSVSLPVPGGSPAIVGAAAAAGAAQAVHPAQPAADLSGGNRSPRISTASSNGSGKNSSRPILPPGSYSGGETTGSWQQELHNQEGGSQVQERASTNGLLTAAGAAAGAASTGLGFIVSPVAQGASPVSQQPHVSLAPGIDRAAQFFHLSATHEQQHCAAAAGGRPEWQQSSAAAGAGSASLHDLTAQSYYEAVTPSSWRPGDADADYPADYLELYRRAYCTHADALFPPVWLGLMAAAVHSQALPLWQLLLLGAMSFWVGLYVMAVRWAGVPSKRLSMSRVAPALVVCLELVCGGAFLSHVLPAMWLGHAAYCLLGTAALFAMLGLHLAVSCQDPGYAPVPEPAQPAQQALPHLQALCGAV
eukprot:gene8922-9099_t